MNKHFLNSILFAFLAIITVTNFVSCTKSDLTTEESSLDALADEVVYALEQRGNLGSHGCYDLVFPFTLKFPDGSTKEITSQDSLKKGCKRFYGSNGQSKKQKPEFVFPIQVIAEDGSVINVTSKEDLQALKEACPRKHLDSLHKKFGERGGFPKHDSLCFQLQFPIKVKKADNSILTINSKEELKALVKATQGNGQGHGRRHGIAHHLELVFPLSVKKADGTTVVVNSKEDLKKLRESCK